MCTVLTFYARWGAWIVIVTLTLATATAVTKLVHDHRIFTTIHPDRPGECLRSDESSKPVWRKCVTD